MRDLEILRQDLLTLSAGYEVTVADDLSFCLVGGFQLPPGYNADTIDVLCYLPSDYPLLPPGVGSSRVYIPSALRYGGRPLIDVHLDRGPGWGEFAWLCFERIDWSPDRDDLATLMEVVRTTLTNPRTK